MKANRGLQAITENSLRPRQFELANELARQVWFISGVSPLEYDTGVVKFCCLLVVATYTVIALGEDITPHIGEIEVYGTHHLSPEKIKSTLDLKPGSRLPSRGDAEEKLNHLSGVIDSRLQAICCNGRNTVLYIGIEERNQAHIDFHSAPTTELALPKEIIEKYTALMDATEASMHAGNPDEDLTNGYSLMADPQCRELQQSLLPLVEANLAGVDQVLRGASDPEQRAMAAYVIQYGPRSVRASKTIADGLQYALQDPDETVRKNAMISLRAVMVGARLHPEQQLHIEPTWFVELMNSIVWSDRHNASLALITLTEKQNMEALSLIRSRALQPVLEMARWQDMRNALPGFILAGRLAGLDEKAIQDAWVKGQREPVLQKAEYPNGKKSGIMGLARRDPKKD